ncbi:MAG: helix-turn-helix domain-containing protein [Eubacteriales bacterium]|nr:helix-turn-helix domain-containing protein [Eubacteriales bacterium]
MRKDHYLLRFVLVYLCVLLPMLCVSFFLNYRMLNTLRESTARQAESSLKGFSDELTSLYAEHTVSSAFLSNETVLNGRNMLKNKEEASTGITLLNFANQFNAETTDIFMCYGTETVYSGKGLSRLSTLLGITLQCRKESVALARSMVHSKTNGVCVLWSGDADGYLLMHFITDRAGMESVNYVIPLSRLIARFRPVDERTNVDLVLDFEQGGTVAFHRDDEESFCLGRGHVPEDSASGVSAEHYNDTLGVRLSVRYETTALQRQLAANRNVNSLVMALGLLVSVAISFFLSMDRRKRVYQLEAIAKGETVALTGRRGDEFSSLQRLMTASLREAQRINESQQVYREGFCRQFARLLFSGMYKDRQVVASNLSLCGVELMEQYYAVLGVRLPAQGQEQSARALERLLAGSLYHTAYIFDQPVVVFLHEFPNSDESQSLRLDYAAWLRGEMGGVPLAVGVSRVYGDIMRAPEAYADVERIFEQLPAADAVLCRESLPEAPDLAVRFSAEELTAMTDAVARKEEDVALTLLRRMEAFIRDSACSEANQTFLRYTITQALIQGVQGDVNEKSLISDVVQVDVSNGQRFDASMTRLLKRCCAGAVTVTGFELILDYIRANYQNPSFSAEMVAEYAGLSTSYLSRLFKAKMGMTYIDYLTSLRMKRATELIRQTNLPLRDIVEQVGYIDVSGFRRKFKALYGMSVTEYKQSLGGQEE